MSYHLEKRKIYALIDESGLDRSLFVVGAGQTYDKRKMRFEFKTSRDIGSLKDAADYAIKYFQDRNIYIVWNVKVWSKFQTAVRSCFSVACEEVEQAMKYKLSASKAAVYSGWGREAVSVLTYEELKNFVSGIASDKHD